MQKGKNNFTYQKQHCGRQGRNAGQNGQENGNRTPIHSRRLQIARTRWFTSQGVVRCDLGTIEQNLSEVWSMVELQED